MLEESEATLLPQATVMSILGVLSSKDQKIKYPWLDHGCQFCKKEVSVLSISLKIDNLLLISKICICTISSQILNQISNHISKYTSTNINFTIWKTKHIKFYAYKCVLNWKTTVCVIVCLNFTRSHKRGNICVISFFFHLEVIFIFNESYLEIFTKS